MILITGSTGQFGRATIDFLLKKGIAANNITAMVRDAAKAEDLKKKGINIKVGDYENYDGLLNAFKGIDKLFLISSNDLKYRGRQHTNAVKAAKEAGVKYILFTSFDRINETESSPIAMLSLDYINTEKLIRASGLKYTIMRNTLYADTLPMYLGPKVLETGVILPAGDGRAAFTERIDMAEAAANILAGSGHENKEYVITNEVNYSLNDVAKALSEITGKDIKYISPEINVYKDNLSKTGMPEVYVSMIAAFGEAIKQGEFKNTGNDLSKLLGRKPATLKEYLKSVYGKVKANIE